MGRFLRQFLQESRGFPRPSRPPSPGVAAALVSGAVLCVCVLGGSGQEGHSQGSAGESHLGRVVWVAKGGQGEGTLSGPVWGEHRLRRDGDHWPSPCHCSLLSPSPISGTFFRFLLNYSVFTQMSPINSH